MATLIKIDRNGSKHYKGYIKCDRCGGRGLYAIGTLNGEPLITTVDNGICHKCLGVGKVASKWIERTPEYQAKLDARREKKAEEKRQAWLKEHEEELKAEQLRIAAEKAEKERQEALEEARKAISQYVGEVGERMNFIGEYEKRAWFTFRNPFGQEETMYVHTFKTPEGNKLVWKTSSNGLGLISEGSSVDIKGTVKGHSEYKGEKQTVLTRCKVNLPKQDILL